MVRFCAIATVTGLAAAASAQDFTISASAPATVNAGDTFTVEFWGSVTGTEWVQGTSAMSGFGIDAIGSGSVASVSSANVASYLAVGVLTGTVNGASVEGIVAGQIANVFNLNPGINMDNPMFLFSLEVTAGGLGSITYIGGNPNPNGGLSFYPDSTDGGSISAGVDAGTTMNFTGATTQVIPAPASTLALIGLGGLVSRRRR